MAKPAEDPEPVTSVPEATPGTAPAKVRKPWQIQPGQRLNPHGRPKGTRNAIQEHFLRDFVVVWQQYGEQALRRCAIEEPGKFVKIAAMLLPRNVEVSATVDVAVDVTDFRQRFDHAVELLGNKPGPKLINGRHITSPSHSVPKY